MVVDSGDYGAATITQPVSISAIGVVASITQTASGQNALTINTTGNVTITGLGLHGLGSGNDGIQVQQVGVLRLYHVTAEGFNNDGVEFDAGGQLSIQDSRFTDNQYGLAVTNASAQAFVRRTSFDHNSIAGIYAPFGVVTADDSSAHFNGAGFQSSGGTFVIARSRSIFNGTGVSAVGASATMQFSYCSVAGNSLYAYRAASGAAVSGTRPGTSVVTGTTSGTPSTAATLQ